jgi:hypothetical protein
VEVEVEEIDVTAAVQDDNQMDYDDEGGCLCLSFRLLRGDTELKNVFRYLWNLQNHYY